MEYAARMRGAEGMSFPTIVASGERSALPHGRASTALLPSGGFVVLDFGVILSGYCSDMTRTVHLGKPSARARGMYESVRRAQSDAIKAVRPGISFAEVDRIARRRLEKDGWGEFFTHSTGHGVGLEIHEPPRLAAGQKGKLRPGMIITVEPGVYVPGEGGVRIEDTVLVTERGHEVLTPAGKQLIVL
jgi:Xaa-Pro aminopeptidase